MWTAANRVGGCGKCEEITSVGAPECAGKLPLGHSTVRWCERMFGMVRSDS
jgi:hypothetical protein